MKCRDCQDTGLAPLPDGNYLVCQCGANANFRRPGEDTTAHDRRPNDWAERASDKRRAWAKARGL